MGFNQSVKKTLGQFRIDASSGARFDIRTPSVRHQRPPFVNDVTGQAALNELLPVAQAVPVQDQAARRHAAERSGPFHQQRFGAFTPRRRRGERSGNSSPHHHDVE